MEDKWIRKKIFPMHKSCKQETVWPLFHEDFSEELLVWESAGVLSTAAPLSVVEFCNSTLFTSCSSADRKALRRFISMSRTSSVALSPPWTLTVLLVSKEPPASSRTHPTLVIICLNLCPLQGASQAIKLQQVDL